MRRDTLVIVLAWMIAGATTRYAEMVREAGVRSIELSLADRFLAEIEVR